MKIYLNQLAPLLKRELSSLYLVTGPELLLLQETEQLLRKTAEAQQFNEYHLLTADTSFSWEEGYNILYNQSIFAEKQFIHLRLTHKPAAIGQQILQEYCLKPLPDRLLLISVESQLKINHELWYQTIAKNGIVITITSIDPSQLPSWINKRAAEKGVHLTSKANEYLVTLVIGNLLAADQAIEKLSLWQQGQESKVNIDENMVKLIVSNQNYFNIYDLIDHLLSGEQQLALAALVSLHAENLEPALLLWALLRELRLLITMTEQEQQGISRTTLYERHRIWSKRQKAVSTFLNRFSLDELYQLLRQASDIDPIIKGLVPGHAWQVLERWCLAWLGIKTLMGSKL